jgi:hypothetical protein
MVSQANAHPREIFFWSLPILYAILAIAGRGEIMGRLPRLALALCLGITAAAWAQNDIECYSTKKQSETPGECIKGCNAPQKKGENGLAHMDNYCGLEPQCVALEDQQLMTFYNRAVPVIDNPTSLASGSSGILFGGLLRPHGRLSAAPGVAQKALIDYIIDHFYSKGGKEFSSTAVQVQYGEPPHGGACELDREGLAAGQARPDLWVAPYALDKSPAYLVSCIGHELIHREQSLRPRQPTTGISLEIDAFRELEAWTWETGEMQFAWKIGGTRVHGCLAQKEKQELDWGVSCYQWKIRRYIEEMNETKKKYMPGLERWLKNDAWTSTKWLPANQDWQSLKAGTRPENCPDPFKQ